jgi:HD-like signal output (HDOD) protein
MKDTRLQDVLHCLDSFPPLPTVATRVLELVAHEDMASQQLTEVIGADPILTSNVLDLCNSAICGFQRQIASIEEASNLLGKRPLASLVITSISGQFFKSNSEDAASDQPGIWVRCLTNAIAAKLLAAHHGGVNPENAYAAGLLQDCSLLIGEEYLGESSDQVRREMACGRTLVEAERQVLGMSHSEISARMLASWKVPASITETVRHHHEPDQASEHPVMTATLCLAEALSALLYRKRGLDWPAPTFGHQALDRCGLTHGDLLPLVENLEEQLDRYQESLGVA